MNKLLTTNAAIQYLREQAGSMSYKTFMVEINAGRIPYKPYGCKMRFRKTDLDTWLNTTETHRSDYTNAAKRGTRTSRLSLMDDGLSFAKLLEQRSGLRRNNGQSAVLTKS